MLNIADYETFLDFCKDINKDFSENVNYSTNEPSITDYKKIKLTIAALEALQDTIYNIEWYKQKHYKPSR